MYESFFDFSARPFAAAPLVENYYPAESIEHARQTLIRIVDRAEGPGIVVGQAGLGKSLLCRLVVEYFRESFDVVLLSSARIGTRKSLLQSILFELGRPYLELGEGELRLGLLDFLQPGKSSPNGMLLIVDEACSLPPRLLDEIRMITNLVREGQPRARLIMAGGPQLEERFAHPKLASFNQRLAARCYLDNFGREDTFRYVHSQIRAVGGDTKSLFTESALEAVHRAADGIPRLINQICDHALVLGCAGGKRQLDQFGIEEAWADLQQLPGPWTEPVPTNDDFDVVEFGELDEYPASEENGPALSETTNSAGREDDIEDSVDQLDLSTGMNLLATEIDQGTEVGIETAEDLFAGPPPSEPVEAKSDITSREIVVSGPADYHSLSIDCFENAPAVELGLDNLAATPECMDEQVENLANDTSDPFGTGFDEEEVIIDRSTALAIEAFRGRPVVSSSEGIELASLLDEFDIGPQTDLSESSLIDLSPIEGIGHEMVHEVDSVPELGAEVARNFEHTVYQVDETFDDIPEVELAAEREVQAILEESENEFTCVAFPDLAGKADDDRELMIIRREPGLDSTESPALVKRVEYQELFAQLRKA